MTFHSMPALVRNLLILMRVPQWSKNLFVLIPLFFTPSVQTFPIVRETFLGALCFCLVSSGVYILNDWHDRASDRLHPGKRFRPLATGSIPLSLALTFMALLLLAGLGGAYTLSLTFFQILLGYLVLNLAYSFGLKHVAIVDVLIIATGFVLRVDAGAALIHVRPSVWILICTGLLALFLALAKRRDDLVKALDATHRPSLTGYNTRFLDASLSMVLGALLVSYVIYTTDTQVMARLGSDRLYLTVLPVLAGVLRYLQITLVLEASASPTRILFTDRFLMLTILAWLGLFAILIY